MVKEDEKTLKKRKSSPDPKAATSKKRRAATPEPKMAEMEEGTPSTPSATEVEEILKVMTRILTYQDAKSSRTASDEAFTEERRAFGNEKGGWA
jgi:hypothetical protein